MKLKIRIKPGQFLSDLFRRFAPSAVICLLLTAAAIAYSCISIVSASEVIKAVDKPFTYAFSALGMGLLFTTTAAVLCERYGWRKFISWIASAVGAVCGALLFYLSEMEIAVGSITGSIILSFLALCLHAVSQKDAPAVRLFYVCAWFGAAFAISVLIFAVLSVCGTAIFALLAQNASSNLQDIFYSTSVCISFLLLAPYIFLGGLPKQNTPPNANSNRIACRFLLPMYLLFLSILLVYVAKIAITFTMPVGVMNSYGIAALTLFTMLHLILIDDENRLVKWFNNWSGLLLVPIVVVQGIGVWMRVSAYGLTEMRVLGLVWTALCIAVVITSLFRKRANWFFLAAAAVSIVIFCTPLNAQNIAIMSQESRLSAALERNDMLNEQGEIVANPNISVEDQEIIYSAINYLEDVTPRKGSLTEQLHSQTEELAENSEYSRRSSFTKSELLGFNEPENADSSWYAHYYYLYGSAKSSELDTRGYSYAELITVRQYSEGAVGDFEVTYEAADETRYGTTDVCALTALIEANHGTAAPIEIDMPITFMIDGEEVDLTPLLNGAIFEGDNADMIGDTIILPSGKKLHFQRVYIVNYSSEASRDMISFTAWLLTP